MNDFDLIEEYLKGNLQGQALRDFESRLASDRALTAMLEEHKDMHDLVFTQGLLGTREKLQQIRKIKQSDKRGGNNWYKGIFGLLLCIGLTATLYVFINHRKNIPVIHTDKREGINGKNGNTVQIASEDDTSALQIPAESKSSVTQKKAKGDSVTSSGTASLAVPLSPPFVRDTVIQNAPARDDALGSERSNTALTGDICSKVRITAMIETEESCEEKPTGKIHVSQVSGGRTPYRLSLDGSTLQNQGGSFLHLQAGKYQVVIKDADECYTTLTADVAGKSCASEAPALFSPDYGETWKFPVNGQGTCKVRVYNAAGALVYEVSISQGYPSEWNGTGTNGEYIKGGTYLYEISCDDGTMKQGSVTVVR